MVPELILNKEFKLNINKLIIDFFYNVIELI